MADIRAGYGFGAGDIAITREGERLTVAKIRYRGSEGAVAYCWVDTTDGRTFDHTEIERYERPAL